MRDLSFDRLVHYLDQFHYGYFRMAGMTWAQMMKRDYQLRIDAPKRFKSVSRHGFEIVTVVDLDPSEKALAEEQQEFLQEFYDNVTCYEAMDADNTGGFSLLVRQMMESIAYYKAVHEIVWKPQDDGSLQADFIYCPIWWFEGVRGKLRYLQSEFQAWGEEMEPGEWLITSGDGVMEVCSIIYMMKYGALKSWMQYLDKFGIPGLLGKTHSKQGSPEWDAMKEALQNFSQEWSTVIGGCAGDMKDNDITLLEAKGATGGETFEKLIEMLDRKETQLFRGGDLTTTSSQPGGSGASLQGDEGEILETDDAKMIEETLMSQVSRVALAWRFGDDAKELAFIKLKTTPKDTVDSDIKTGQFILNAGGSLAKDSTYKRFGWQVPKDDEEVLTMPTPQASTDYGSDGDQDQWGGGYSGDQQPEEGDDNGDKSGQFAQTRSLNRIGRRRAQFANLRPDMKAFDNNAKKEFLKAYVSDVSPLVDRLKAIYRIEDEATFRNRLSAFLADIDRLKKDLSHDSEAAQAIQKILSSSLANGLAEARSKTRTTTKTK